MAGPWISHSLANLLFTKDSRALSTPASRSNQHDIIDVQCDVLWEGERVEVPAKSSITARES